MKKTIILGGIGAVVVTLLMISSVTATNVVQSDTMITQKKDVYVEPNICLTQKYLPILKRSVKQLQNPEYKKIVQEIIELLEEKGKVTSGDIQNIVDDSPVSLKAVYALGMIDGSGIGGVVCFPFSLLKARPLLGILTIPLPTLIMKWDVDHYQHAWDNPCEVHVKPQLLNQVYDKTNHNGGMAIGYVGLATNSGPWGFFPQDFWFQFTIIGAFILLFIN